ncbi:hypothetical protein AAW14_36975 [Streptomyces hygroscopicus]|nr:hypothetical protein [Streptomyces hygroscopicus]
MFPLVASGVSYGLHRACTAIAGPLGQTAAPPTATEGISDRGGPGRTVLSWFCFFTGCGR